MSILELSSSKDSFTLTKNYLTLDIETYQKEVFREKGFTVIKDFISKDAAIIIKKLLLKNEKCFSKGSEEGNHRLFIYPNSPYIYPTVLMQLHEYISVIKNVIYSSEKFYDEYCLTIKQDKFDFFQILKYQSKHTWSCFFWYKNNESHFKHIDNYGEFTTMLILSQLYDDYNEGGFYYEKGNDTIYLDEFYEYGDLVFFDQENYYHEVKNIYTKNSCVDHDSTCNTIQPYSELVLYATDIDTNKPYTSKKRNEKMSQFENICSVRSKTLSKCCDKQDPRLDKLTSSIPEKVFKRFPFVKKVRENGKDKYIVCRGDNCNENSILPDND